MLGYNHYACTPPQQWPGPNISVRVQAAIEILGERKEKLDKMLENLAGVRSDEIEAAATVFAAWNDFLIDGHHPTDDEIIREALENWHPEKKLKRLFNRLTLKATWRRISAASLQAITSYLPRRAATPAGMLPSQ